MINISLTPAEAIRAASSVKTSVERMRLACRETDAEFCGMNNIYRDAIKDQRGTHRKILYELRLQGWPMTGDDIEDDLIDQKLKA